MLPDLNQPVDLNQLEEGVEVEEVVHIDFQPPLEMNKQTVSSGTFEPFKGQCFLSKEEAYLFYKSYAKQHGFAIRKARFDNDKNGEIKRRDFFCHRVGKQPLKVVDPSKDQRNRNSIRCECKAHMRIALKRSIDIFPEEWQVIEFIEEHNHSLLAKEEVRFLSSYRGITNEDEKKIFLLKEGGLSVRQTMRVMELEKNVAYGHLPFTIKDVHNLYSRRGMNDVRNDAMDLLQHCKDAKEENCNFQYSFTLDADNKLEHIFWSPAYCFDWYQRFGDVVVFDTTYKINAYDMPFGFFVGTDNHGRTILFGCALLRNETLSAFTWLMKTFKSLKRSSPKTILTDQDPWMTRAIAEEMPSTKHAFCIWHITFKFSSWFTALLRNHYPKWCADFYSLYKLDCAQDFEREWPQVVQKYNMQKNKHILGLYEIRHFWVPAYLREHFFAGMTTTGRSESINSFIKRFISSHVCLKKFLNQVDLAIEDIGQKQIHANMLDKFRGSSLRTLSPLEKQACDILTPYAFRKFQDEFGRAAQYLVTKNSTTEFVVSYYKLEVETQKHEVSWDGQATSCSCKKFEFLGILCRHILSVFIHEGVFTIPSTYFPLRWHHSIQLLEASSLPIDADNDQGISKEVDVDQLVQCPPKSKTKGRPKQKRLRSGKELNNKQVKTCRFCKCSGHNYTTCPKKGAVEEIGGLQGAQKQKKDANKEDMNPVFHFKM